MAGMQAGDRGALNSEPNVVPMIDILLVLLIIFMILQPLARMAMDVQVPPEEVAETPPEQSTQIVLDLTDGGGYEINGEPVPKPQLANRLEQIYHGREPKLLFIKAGPNRVYQEVIEAMDLARGAGVALIGFTPQETR